uniref:Uncharacterized protein n=1 Tax=Arion vulgaris TaxID=1028688 RepID=A0A0B6ZF65_9EUPU
MDSHLMAVPQVRDSRVLKKCSRCKRYISKITVVVIHYLKNILKENGSTLENY